jgi:hypothetical protein
MPTSSTIITPPGRRLESGRRARNVLTSVFAGCLSSALGVAAPAGEAVELSEAQVLAAQIRARTAVCAEEAPAVAAHMEQAYSEWLDRNPAIAQEALHSLYFGLPMRPCGSGSNRTSAARSRRTRRPLRKNAMHSSTISLLAHWTIRSWRRRSSGPPSWLLQGASIPIRYASGACARAVVRSSGREYLLRLGDSLQGKAAKRGERHVEGGCECG